MTTLPPLLAAMEGRKPRAPRERVTVPLESKLHFWVAKLLREHCLPDWRWTHFPAGEERPVRAAAKLKRMGLQRGWPDFLLFSPEMIVHGLELKRLGEELTDEQRDFGDWLWDHGGLYGVVWTMDMALKVMCHWGCLRVEYPGGSAE